MASTNSTDKKKIFLRIFKEKGCNISISCEAADIDRGTYYNWYNKDKKFQKKVKELQERLLDFTESKLLQNINDGKEASIFFHLKCRAKSRGYVERQEIEHSGIDAIKVIFDEPSNNTEQSPKEL